MSVDLSLRDDDLDGRHVVGAREGLVENANRTDDLADFLDQALVASVQNVAGVANDQLALSDLFAGLHTAHATLVVVQDLFNVLVEHESTTLDRTHSRETFRNTTKTVDWVDERRVTISSDGVHIQFDFVDSFDSRSFQELVIRVQRNGVTDEIDSIWFQIELAQQLSHGHSRQIVLFLD